LQAARVPLARASLVPQDVAAVKKSPWDVLAIGLCTFAWGTTWYAVTLQLGVVDPMVSVVYRFGLASVVLFVWCLLRKEPIGMTAAQHLWTAGLGLTGFTLSYAMTYEAETRVVSAVVAVLFASLAFTNLIVFRVVFGQRARASAWLAALLGACGVALLSWGEIAHARESGRALVGVVLTLLSVLASAAGNVFARNGEHAGAPLAASTLWAQIYGTLFLAVYVLAAGRPFGFEATPRYAFSLLYLAIVGSVVAFLCFFHVARARGYTTASYILALTPLLAMTMSALFEGKTWSPMGIAGVALVLLGQWMLLRSST
jgi:drug/metabolite transporter (DMT)-like permease